MTPDYLITEDKQSGREQYSNDGEDAPLIRHAAEGSSRVHNSDAASTTRPAGRI